MPEAWSNSSDPLLAVASALSGRYPGTPDNERDRRRLTAMLAGDNAVADLLRSNGYITSHLGAPTAGSTWFRGPDQSVAASGDELADAIDAAPADGNPHFVFAATRLAPDCQPPPDDATVAVIVHHGVACAFVAAGDGYG